MSMRLEALISSEQYVDALKLLHSREFNDNVGDKEIIKYNKRILDLSKPDDEPTVTVDTSVSNIATMVYAATRGTIPKGITEQELIDFASNLASSYPATPTVKQFQSDIRKHIAQVATDTTLGFKSDKKAISEVPDWQDLSLDSTAGEIRNDVVTYMKSKGITRPLGDENREEFNRLASELAVRRSRKNVVE